MDTLKKRIDLSLFCLGVGRPELAKPFSFGVYTYATNGHILIRVPRVREIQSVDVNSHLTGIDGRLPFDHEKIETWIDLPEVEIEKSKCKVCLGSGTVCFCPECKGEGSIEFNTIYSYYDVACRTCEGEGFVPKTKENKEETSCENCSGRGTLIESKAINVGRNDEVGLNAVYLDLMKKLPGIKLSLYGDTTSPFRFKFDGGVGLVMPMRF